MAPIEIRTQIKPGDIGYITYLHGKLYAEEYGFDHTFDAYVGKPIAEFILNFDAAKDRLWVADMDGQMVGCIAIVGQPENEAQLRWFLVHPSARGQGLGRRLLGEAMQFCRDCGFDMVFLWTLGNLDAALKLYTVAGFRKTAEKSHHIWGQALTEERYELNLTK